MLEINAVHNAHGPGRDEVTRDHPHGGIRHGRVGQALAEGGLNLVAQLPGGLLRAVQRHLVGDADAMRVFGGVALGLELFVHLRPETMHQHDLHAHTLNHRQVLRQMVQLARGDGFARNAHHKGLVAKFVDVRRDRAEPRNEGEIEDSGHAGFTRYLRRQMDASMEKCSSQHRLWRFLFRQSVLVGQCKTSIFIQGEVCSL